MLTLKKPLLRITRGQSQFPLRAIDQKRFLIGAGSSCHLLLTHAKIPMIFALVQPTDEGCTIEAYHPVPPMLVNGEKKRTAELLSGDQLTIGPYEFEFLVQETEHTLRAVDGETVDEVKAEEAEQPEFNSIIPDVPSRLTELSAEELVDRIARELNLIEELGDYDDPPMSQTPRKTA